MDSGNSGSLQSSSGGDEEYDSRTDLISAFINHPSAAHFGSISAAQPLQPPPQHGKNSTTFDPLSNYFDPMSRPPLQNPCSSLVNLDMVWSKTIRSDPNCTSEINNPLLASSSSFQPYFGSQNPSRAHFTSQNLAVAENTCINSTSVGIIAQRAPSSSTDQAHVVRNPKKRSRASRRAPTTVLTTDTTNFRAMVQEFTGIPAPPFTSSSFPRSRFDLFGTPPSTTMRFNPLDVHSQAPYLHRPFPQKVQQQSPPPFLSSSSSSSSMLSSSMADALGTTMSSGGTNITTSRASTNVNYQLPCELSLLKQPCLQSTNLFSMQNPILTSLLQSNPPKSPLENPPIIGSKTQGPMQIPSSDDSHLRMGFLNEFGLGGHGHVNSNLSGLPGLGSSAQTVPPRNDDNLPSWGINGAGANGGGDQVRSVNGNNYGFSRNAANGKLNYSASSSSFHSDKGIDNVAARSEGMVETWICSSD